MMKKILVIEDDALFLNIIRKALSSAGHFVETADCGEAGLKSFYNDRFDLVITDFHLGSITGLDVAKNIRKSNSAHTPIICVTGDNELNKNGHFNLIIKKPFSILTLLAAVDEAIGKGIDQ